ncbi:MAG: NAD(P)H-dependent glycerol-3-phosphate dehydrogenase [Holosporaceae bacterium]|jgi:glycerol-3-phosphate dehydrogenase (NAD(P)+)|nr:NAD(P)H-dependent glycerol-3-phosphate dehydrogenase [Holosporaceae bacterium]
MISLEKIGIVGAGCYGTAIAQCFSQNAKKILLISNSKTTASSINNLHMNLRAFPGILLSPNIECTDVFSEIQNCGVVFFALPMSKVLSVCRQIKKYGIKTPLVLCSKGFDAENGRLQSDAVEEILDNNFAVLSGPSFAHEIVQGLPAGVNIAGKDMKLSRCIAECLSTPMFKIEAIDDYIGLQVVGALKNVLAIGCGILSGLKFGGSAISRLIVDGLREMAELSNALGGKKETIFELGGIGDVILTCTSRQSRNVLFGEYLATGGNLKNWTGELAEGVSSAKAIPLFERSHNISMVIFSEIYQAIYKNKNLCEVISRIIWRQ